MATELLEHNKLNRPVNQNHVDRIARQIAAGKWIFNGDTIKIANGGDVLDGQHRIWAVVETNTAVETIVVYGVQREAFATVDTLRKPRSGGDTLSLHGVTRYRNFTSEALKWLIRYQRNIIEEFRTPTNRVENSDIEEAFMNNPNIVRAVERASKVRGLANPGIVAFLYYVLHNRSEDLAERMINTLLDPSNASVNDPFFRFRVYFTADHHKAKDPVVTIALGIKAANMAAAGQKTQALMWKHQGVNAEEFPKLKV